MYDGADRQAFAARLTERLLRPLVDLITNTTKGANATL